MKLKEIQELKNITAAELESRLKDLRAKLQELLFEKNTGKIKNPRAISATRKDIARLLTILNQKNGSTGSTSSPQTSSPQGK